MDGFLPSASLIDSLIQICKEMVNLTNEPGSNLLQTRNISATIRRIKLLSSLFEEIRYSVCPLPPSSILCLTELFSVIRQTKELVSNFFMKSAVWNLIQSETVSQQFYTCAKEMAKALDILPLSLIDIPCDVHEQVELLHRQVKRVDICIDPQEIMIRDELFRVMAKEDKDGCSKYVDFKRLEVVLGKIGLKSAMDYQEEMSRLGFELKEQAGTGGLVAVSNINNLISLISYAKSLFFNSGTMGITPVPSELEQQPSKSFSRSSSWSVSSSPSLNSTIFSVPDEYRCPITLDLMRDPVIVASGHTYDRASIARWINSGHHTCPKSGQKLIHMALIPNYAMKSLIGQWCKENNVPLSFFEHKDSSGDTSSNSTTNQFIDHISAVKVATEAVRMTAEFLVGKLAMGSPEIQRQASYELRILAKNGMNNRRMIAEAGAIPFLVTLLRSCDPLTQENAVTAILNLSIFDNNKILIMAAGAIDAIIEVLKTGAAMEARENAAAVIFSLTMVDECKITIGSKKAAIAGLVCLLREGTTVGKKDAATALFNIAMYNGNRSAMVDARVVPVLIDLLMDEKAGITDEALAVLSLICGCGEGMKAIGESRAIASMLVDLIRFGSGKGKEHSISILLGLCRDGGEEMGKRLLMNPRSVPSLHSLVATGSTKARRKADALLRLLNRICSQS